MKILITGGAGFIARNLVRELLKRNYNIITIYRETIPKEFIGKVKMIQYKGNYNDLEENLEGEQIDIVIHLATHFTSKHRANEIRELFESNILLGTHILEYMKEHKAKKFINTSTYATSIDGTDYNPQNLYSATKKAFEDILVFYVESEKMQTINLELSDTYGLGDTRPKFLNLLLNAIKENREFNMSPGEQEICYIHVRDVVNAYLRAIDMLVNEDIKKIENYSVYGDEVLTLNQLVNKVQDISGTKIQVNKGVYPYKEREIMKFKPKYPILPGWQPRVSLTQGILEVLEGGTTNEN
ncbi:MAG TPA: NAD(P)-dependent oxidoreductase [Defluviitoga tunisiensis]|nr:NAD(P)-dependent oxidoreductase [Defluviitoga tunisiensis]HPP10989.1 NAD(P)-dependent oxidoreductase [Defluviitoga tunisiensis]